MIWLFNDSSFKLLRKNIFNNLVFWTLLQTRSLLFLWYPIFILLHLNGTEKQHHKKWMQLEHPKVGECSSQIVVTNRQDEDKSLNELMYKDNCHQDFKQKINSVPFNSPFHAICFICNQAKKIFFKFADFYIYPEKMIVHDKFLRPFADST